jgi:hypothetical protein
MGTRSLSVPYGNSDGHGRPGQGVIQRWISPRDRLATAKAGFKCEVQATPDARRRRTKEKLPYVQVNQNS